MQDDELMAAMEKLTAIEAESRAKDKQIADLQFKLAKMESALTEVEAKKEAAVAQMKAKFVTAQAQQLVHLRTALHLKREELYKAGACDFKAAFLNSPHGQQFLDVLLNGMLEAYRAQPQFLCDAGPAIGYFMKEAGRLTLEQVEATSEQLSKYDPEVWSNQVDEQGALIALGMNPEGLDEEGWWMPPIEKAARMFVDANPHVEVTDSVGKYVIPFLQDDNAGLAKELARVYRMPEVPTGSDTVERVLRRLEDIGNEASSSATQPSDVEQAASKGKDVVSGD